MSGVLQVRLATRDLYAERPELASIRHDWAIVVSQDCDFERDYEARADAASAGAAKVLPNVLFCECRAIPDGTRLPDFDKGAWKRIEGKRDNRYRLLPPAPPQADRLGLGCPELLVDFKRYFTIPTDELYARLRSRRTNRPRRRVRLRTPYREDLASRFYGWQSRIALPGDDSA